MKCPCDADSSTVVVVGTVGSALGPARRGHCTTRQVPIKLTKIDKIRLPARST